MKVSVATFFLFASLINYGICQGYGAKMRNRLELLDTPKSELSRLTCQAAGFAKYRDGSECEAYCFSHGEVKKISDFYPHPDGTPCGEDKYVCKQGSCDKSIEVYKYFSLKDNSQQKAQKTCAANNYPSGRVVAECNTYCYFKPGEKNRRPANFINYPDGLPCGNGYLCKNGQCDIPRQPGLVDELAGFPGDVVHGLGGLTGFGF